MATTLSTTDQGEPSSSVAHRSEGALKELLERKIPTLPTFPSDRLLDGKNYSTWSMQMEAVLETYDLAVMVLTDLPRPTEEQDPIGDERYQWDRFNARIRSFIIINCTPSVLAHIRHLTLVRQIWLHLDQIYNRMTPMKRAGLEVTMRQLDPSRCASMKEYIDKVQILQQEIAHAGKTISPTDMAILLLSKLPPKFSAFYSSLITSGRVTELTWDELVPMVLDQEDRFKSTSKSESSALTAKAKPKGNKGKKPASSSKANSTPNDNLNKERTCHKCGAKGHIRKDCPKQNSKSSADETATPARASAFVHIHEECGVSSHETLLAASSSREWILDSGATRHMTPIKEGLLNFQPMQGKIYLGDDTSLPIRGVGSLPLASVDSGGTHNIEVLYVPKLHYHLLSVFELCKAGFSVEFDDNRLTVKHKDSKAVSLEGAPHNGIYRVSIPSTALVSSTSSSLWHARYGHLNNEYLRKATKLVDGLPSIPLNKDLCSSCVKGKQHRDNFPKQASRRATKVLELVHMDLCGPMQTMSLGGSLYFMLIIDDFSRITWVFFLHLKNEAFPSFVSWLTLVEKESGHSLKTVRADKGGEFTSNAMKDFCREHGIRQEFANTNTPSENGVVERKNRTVVEMARTMLTHMQVPQKLWAEAVSTAVHIINRSPTSSLTGKTPYEAYFGKKPDVSHFRVFGCPAYAHIPSTRRGKFDEKSRQLLFVGYNSQSTGYRLYDPLHDSICLSRDVVFQEESTSEGADSTSSLGDAADSFPSSTPLTPDIIDAPPDLSEESIPLGDDVDVPDEPLPPPVPRWARQTIQDSGVDLPTLAKGTPSGVRRSTRLQSHAAPDVMYTNYSLMARVLKSRDPIHLGEALAQPVWRKAMEIELQAIHQNDTWELVPRPQHKKVIGVKWVYKTKYLRDGSLDKHKARLVVKGYAQRPGLDFDDTFAPTARVTTIRTVLAVAGKQRWPIYQMDVKSAFLNGDVKEEIYVEQPPGFFTSKTKDMVYRLKKALYGLKQAPRVWNEKIDMFFCKIGFSRSKADPQLYVYLEKPLVAIIVLYVDDLIITGNHVTFLESTKLKLQSQFDMTDMGVLHYFLGLEVYQHQTGIFISQQRYVSELLLSFGMEDSRTITSPMDVNQKFSIDTDSPPADIHLYRKLIGSLIWLLNTRCDLSFPVSLLAGFMGKPLLIHWHAGLRILRYLKTTPALGLFYEADTKDSTSLSIYGWTDSDWAGDVDHRRSTTGYCFTLGSGAISWSSKKQPTVSLSSTEAEYRAACTSTCEVVWLRRLLGELGFPQQAPTLLLCDNQSCLAIARNPVFHTRTKHIEVQYHFIREKLLNGEICLEYCHTDSNHADLFTKPLSQTTISFHSRSLRLIPCPWI